MQVLKMALPVPAFDSLPLVNIRTGVDISSRLQQLSLQLPGVLLEKLPQLWAFTQEREREGNEPRVNRKREGGEETVHLQATGETGTVLEPGHPEFQYQLPPCLRGFGLDQRLQTGILLVGIQPVDVSLIFRAFLNN